MLCQGKCSRAWHARELENAVAFLWRKVGVGANKYGQLKFHPIGPERDIKEISKRCAGHPVYPVEQATPSLIQSNAEDGGPGRRQ